MRRLFLFGPEFGRWAMRDKAGFLEFAGPGYEEAAEEYQAALKRVFSQAGIYTLLCLATLFGAALLFDKYQAAVEAFLVAQSQRLLLPPMVLGFVGLVAVVFVVPYLLTLLVWGQRISTARRALYSLLRQQRMRALVRKVTDYNRTHLIQSDVP